MRKVRLHNEEVIYDCDGINCHTPDVPHKKERDEIMAALATLVVDTHHQNDFRCESVEIALNLLWKVLYPELADDNGDLPEDPPYAAKFEEYWDELMVMAQFLQEEPGKRKVIPELLN